MNFRCAAIRRRWRRSQAGKFDDEIVPVQVSFTTPNGSKPKRQEIVFKVDEGPRADTSIEALLALKPPFMQRER